MIQPAAQPVASTTLSLAALPAGNGSQGAETGGFADILAGQGDPLTPGSDPTTAPAGLVAGQPDLAAGQRDLAAGLPVTGKILPGLLPDGLTFAAPAVADPAVEAEPAGPDAPGQAIPTLLAAMRALRLPVPALPGAKAPAQLPGQPVAAADAGDDGDTDPTAVAGLTVTGTTSITVSLAVAPADTAAETGPTGQTGLPPMIEAQLLGRPLALRDAAPAAAAAPAARTETASADLALKVDPARIDPAATAALTFEPGAARPANGVRLRPVLAAEAEAPAASAATQSADAASLFAGMAPQAAPLTPAATAGLASPVPAAHGAQPHDFAALMDRLITARDAAQTGLPQSVHVALNHADFGPISLQFQQDQTGLAVSVASADPDFARAVQAAIPAAGASAGADGSARDNAQGSSGQQAWTGQGLGRGDASAAGGETGQRQPRAGTAFAADSAAPARNPGAEARDAAPSRRRGIFA